MLQEVINVHDVLQVDATVIAGLLILLTLLSFKPLRFPSKRDFVFPADRTREEIFEDKEQFDSFMAKTDAFISDWKTVTGEAISRFLLGIMTIGGISIFSISALSILFTGSTDYGKYVMGGGFIFLIAAVLSIVVTSLRNMRTSGNSSSQPTSNQNES